MNDIRTFVDCELRFDFYKRPKGEPTPEEDVQCHHEKYSDYLIAGCRHIRKTGNCPRGFR